MSGGVLRKRLAGGAAIAGCMAAANVAADQLVLDVSSKLEANDNLGMDNPSLGSSLISDTTLGVTYTAETPTSTLTLSGQGVLRFADLPAGRDTADFEDPLVSVDYLRDFSDARLTFGASHRRSDLDFTDPLGGIVDLQQANLVQDRGTLIQNNINLGLTTGVGQPFSTTTALVFNERDYQDTTDPELYDRKSTALDTTLQFEFAPGTIGSLSLGLGRTEAENVKQTERDTRSVSVGISQEVSPVDVVTASVGYTRVDKDEVIMGSPVSSSQDGLTGGLGWTRSLTNGTASATLNLVRDSNGERTNLQFGRAFQTRGGGLFDGTVGASWSESGDPQVIGQVTYSENLLTGRFSLGLSRRITVDANDQDIAATQLSAQYSHEINPLSGIDLAVNVGVTEDGGAGSAPRREVSSFTATYRHQVTQDWSLQSGYKHQRNEDTGGTASSNSVFLTLSRQFTYLR